MHDASERQLLASLRDTHRRLDAEIEDMRRNGDYDQVALARLKKRKLRIRDEIAVLADAMIPDLIA